MKAPKKNPFEKVIYSSENIGGGCMSGKGMTKAEVIKVAAWEKKRKAALKAKQPKP